MSTRSTLHSPRSIRLRANAPTRITPFSFPGRQDYITDTKYRHSELNIVSFTVALVSGDLLPLLLTHPAVMREMEHAISSDQATTYVLQASSSRSSDMAFSTPSTSVTACCTAFICREGLDEAGEGERGDQHTSLSRGHMEPCLFMTSRSSRGLRGWG